MKASILRIDASQPQHTPAGRVLERMWYSPFLDQALTPHEFHGFPHNGGLHTLHLKMSLDDLKAFLELVKETYKAQADGVEEFIAAVMAKAKAA